MRYKGTLLAVQDMQRSKKFYETVLGLKVIDDFGANVMLEGGVFLQTSETWSTFIQTSHIIFKSNSAEIYFEEDHMDDFLERLKTFEIDYVHLPIEHNWGQKAVRFYDVDGHIIEVSESMEIVVKRFYDSGMTLEETAKRMDVPIEYVSKMLQTQLS